MNLQFFQSLLHPWIGHRVVLQLQLHVAFDGLPDRSDRCHNAEHFTRMGLMRPMARTSRMVAGSGGGWACLVANQRSTGTSPVVAFTV